MRKMFPLIVLLLHVCAVYGDGHSLRYYETVVSAPGSGLPEYSDVGYVDDREIVNYNSDTGRYRPKVPWMEKVEDGYWERQTQIGKQNEAVSKHNVRTAMSRFNQTGGFHSFQRMYGCERREDGSITGYWQEGYDGREFLALDTQNGIYIPTMAEAQITTQRWNSPEEQAGERDKNYLQNICIEWLQKYVENGREDLERRVRPRVKVSGQEKGDSMKLHCQVYGFHPRAVDVKIMKNGEDEVHSFETTNVLPNADGTYQIRVSAEVTPKEGDSYSCNVDHSSLKEPLNIVWEPTKTSNIWIIVAVIAGVVVLALGIGGFVLYRSKSKHKKGTVYTPASHSDTSSDTSKVQVTA
ncbi:class I histocompatibility antigen, F10 alpha chain-like isoform 2-T2 [Anomaloglossus baeobatrachus]|uniref:class I histocompatibility antigen, F10 alpha chain-like isoform X2 n=1 Tax=Anomaloglossus baeobatrachus TaxID=238106 RepID=UPI003F4FD83B